jgi:hypothetical protein
MNFARDAHKGNSESISQSLAYKLRMGMSHTIYSKIVTAEGDEIGVSEKET